MSRERTIQDLIASSKNGFASEYRNLCITARHVSLSTDDTRAGCVTQKSNNLILTLCRCISQGSEKLASPVGSDEVSLWNVPKQKLFDIAIDNSPVLFPVSVFDIQKNEYIDMDWDHNGIYDFGAFPETAEAAEDNISYAGAPDSGIRFIIRFSDAVMCAPLIYPHLMKRIAVRSGSNPVILIKKPGEFLVFGGDKALSNAEGYIKRLFGDRFRPKPRYLIYKYLKINRSLQDLSPSSNNMSRERKDARIPAGSVFSAWGDSSMRISMYDWKEQKNAKLAKDKKNPLP